MLSKVMSQRLFRGLSSDSSCSIFKQVIDDKGEVRSCSDFQSETGRSTIRPALMLVEVERGADEGFVYHKSI